MFWTRVKLAWKKDYEQRKSEIGSWRTGKTGSGQFHFITKEFSPWLDDKCRQHSSKEEEKKPQTCPTLGINLLTFCSAIGVLDIFSVWQMNLFRVFGKLADSYLFLSAQMKLLLLQTFRQTRKSLYSFKILLIQFGWGQQRGGGWGKGLLHNAM